ncbi:uncharacterized protein LOC133297415 [Gastrolobium bilobum]|uniref:uncharacterized protein LOC133297415 n=1 Tax=Gastrolobium bilobum TaxID=150636 RepID=UPI002AAF2811|nr:uncharacterized protein LOC133297415 [Gastrolobium bilobum]
MEVGGSGSMHEAFGSVGFKTWQKKDKINVHVGDHKSVHNRCYQAGQDLMKQKQNIDISLSNISEQQRIDHCIRVKTSLDCARYQLQNGHPFLGHDESESSNQQGLFTKWSAFRGHDEYESSNQQDEPKKDAARTDAGRILYAMEDFEFAFLLHLMQLILGISYELSQALQKKDQDLLNAIGLVKVVKSRLQEVRDNDFDELLQETNIFANKYDIDITNIADFDFVNLKRISELGLKMVEKRTNIVYPLVYLLIKLALLLLVATVSVERIFSAMTFVKDKLRNRISDDWFNACMLTYVECDIFDKIDDEDIMQYFQAMKNQRMLL